MRLTTPLLLAAFLVSISSAHAIPVGYTFEGTNDLDWTTSGFITIDDGDLNPEVNVAGSITSFRFQWSIPGTPSQVPCIIDGVTIPGCFNNVVSQPATFELNGDVTNPFSEPLWAGSSLVVDSSLAISSVSLCNGTCDFLGGSFPIFGVETNFWFAARGLSDLDLLADFDPATWMVSWSSPIFSSEPPAHTVPEPETIGLLTFGLFCLLLSRRRVHRVLDI